MTNIWFCLLILMIANIGSAAETEPDFYVSVSGSGEWRLPIHARISRTGNGHCPDRPLTGRIAQNRNLDTR